MSIKIPMAKPKIDLGVLGHKLGNVFKSGWWTMGPVTEQLEKEFSEYVGAKYAVAVNSCSMALFLSLQVSGDVKFDNVVTTPLTFCSTVNAIILSGRVPVLFDVDIDTQCIDFSKIEDNGWKYVDAVIPVHFAGCSCNMDLLMKARGECSEHKFIIIEDCAHSIETKWKGKHVGTFGDFGCYSFNPIKNIAAPEMGMIVTDNEESAKRLRRLRVHGMDKDSKERVESPGSYDIVTLGYKANCTDVEAAVALQQLRGIEGYWDRREEIYSVYWNTFHRFRTEGLFNGRYPNIDHVFELDGTMHGLHLFTIQINDRDQFVWEMKKKGIYCGIHYKPVHLHSYYQRKYGWKRGMFPNAEWIGDYTVSLPLGPGMTDDDVAYVVKSISEVLKKGKGRYLFNI